MKTVALFTLSAVALLLAWRMKRQRDASLDLAGRALASMEDTVSMVEALTGALDHERQTVEGLRGSLPVWFMAGAPLVEVVPMAEDFCLN